MFSELDRSLVHDRTSGLPVNDFVSLDVNSPPIKSIENVPASAASQISLLFLVVAFLYFPALHFEFLHWDDNEYVTRNALVQGGLSWAGIKVAFTTFQYCDYHPLTMLSLMLDRTLFGRWAGGFHLTSVLFHVANVVLLLGIMRRLLPGRWSGFFVALLFAIHPLHVESVAWVSERKDVLSIFFGLLAIRSYLQFAQRSRRSSYLAAVTYFAASLLSKGTLITLPCGLLLIDVWTHRRFAMQQDESIATFGGGVRTVWFRRVIEKLPFFLLSLIYGVVLMRAQTISMASMPLSIRLGNALQSYVLYLRNLFCPLWLSPFYPHPGTALPWRDVAVAGALLVGITACALIAFRRRPALAIGWFWFLGMLVPMLGVVAQVGDQAMADRYMYFPAIGIYIAVVSFVAGVGEKLPGVVRGTLAVAVVLLLVLISFRQVSYWKSDRSLWTRALRLDTNNPMAHLNLGAQEDRDGNSSLAKQHFEKAVERWPNHTAALHRLAVVRMDEGRLPEAKDLIERSLRSKTASPLSRVVLGMILSKQADDAAAIQELNRALTVEPNLPVAHFELAKVFEQRGHIDEAIRHYEDVLLLAPRHPAARQRLDELLGKQP